MSSHDAVQHDAAQLDACVPRIRAGDAQAFEQLFRALHTALVGFALRYTGDTARAEEVVQDVFLAIWQARTEWAPLGSVRGYLFGAVRNRALNLRRRDMLEQDWTNDAAHANTASLHSVAAGADAEAEQMELISLAQAALDALPERCRLVMHLRWREGLSYAEIAESMGIGVKGVENQLSRGLKAVRARVLGT
jgi:RNA polymerase sigma-70 factor (ECF subfamily)